MKVRYTKTLIGIIDDEAQGVIPTRIVVTLLKDDFTIFASKSCGKEVGMSLIDLNVFT